MKAIQTHWPEGVLSLCGITAIAVLLRAPFPGQEPSEPCYEDKPLSYWVTRLDSANSKRAKDAIRSMGLKAAPLLLEKLRQTQEPLPGVVMALGVLGTSAVPSLAHAFADPDDSVRLGAVRALFWMPPICGSAAETLEPRLINLLRDRDNRVRQAAVLTLNRFKSKPVNAAPALIALLTDRETEPDLHRDALLETAARLLGKMGSKVPQAIPPLKELLLCSTNALVREQVALALFRISGETNAIGEFASEAEAWRVNDLAELRTPSATPEP